MDAVRVDVAVNRGGKPVTGLTAGDFELRDSGVLQDIEAIVLEEVPLNLLLALDTSSSLRGEPMRQLKGAAHAAVMSLRPADRAALLTFAQPLRLGIQWSSDTTAIRQAISQLQANGATSLNDAAFAALTLRKGGDGRMLVLLFTDGLDTSSWLDPLAVVEQAHRSDVVVNGVRLETDEAPRRVLPRGLTADRVRQWFLEQPTLFRGEFLSALAEETGGDVVVASGRDLQSAFLKMVAEFKMRYVLAYSPKNVPAGGWHPIDVQLKGKPAEIRARRGYAR